MTRKYLPLLLIPASLFGLLHHPCSTTPPDSAHQVDTGGCYADAENTGFTLGKETKISTCSDNSVVQTPLAASESRGQPVSFTDNDDGVTSMEILSPRRTDSDIRVGTPQTAADSVSALADPTVAFNVEMNPRNEVPR